MDETKHLAIIGEQIKNAKKDTTPFAVVTDEGAQIVGDTSKTVPKTDDYLVKFRFPKKLLKEIPDGSKVVDNYIFYEELFTDRMLLPKNDIKTLNATFPLMQYFTTIVTDENGVEKLKNMDTLESIALMSDLDKQGLIAPMCDFVASFLEIEASIQEYMLPMNLFENTAQILINHPEIINEAASFFG